MLQKYSSLLLLFFTRACGLRHYLASFLQSKEMIIFFLGKISTQFYSASLAIALSCRSLDISPREATFQRVVQSSWCIIDSSRAQGTCSCLASPHTLTLTLPPSHSRPHTPHSHLHSPSLSLRFNLLSYTTVTLNPYPHILACTYTSEPHTRCLTFTPSHP